MRRWFKTLLRLGRVPPPTPGRMGRRQQEIMRFVMSPNGHIDRAMHEEFWSLMAPFRSQEDADAFARDMTDTLRVVLPFQREVWTSVKLSAEAGHVVMSPGYAAAKEAIRRPEDPSDGAQNAIDSAEERIRNAANLAAASSSGDLRQDTIEMADLILVGLEGSIERQRLLTDPQWRGA